MKPAPSLFSRSPPTTPPMPARKACPQVHIQLYYRPMPSQKSGPVCRDLYGFEVEENVRAQYVKWLKSRDPALKRRLRLHYSVEYARRRTVSEARMYALATKGIPAANRPHMWMVWSGAEQLFQQHEPGYYDDLARRAEDPSLRSASTVQIRKDLERTFPTHPIFQSPMAHQELYRILCAFSLRNPKVGYCQSMNFIVGFLQLILREEDAFWMLCMIVERMLPNYFTPDMFSVRVDLRTLEDLAWARMRALMQHLTDLGIQLMQVNTVQWFLCLFVGTLPTETCMKMLDEFFQRGKTVLFAAGLGLLKLNEARLLRTKSYEEAFRMLKDIPPLTFDGQTLMKTGRAELRAVQDKLPVYQQRVEKEMEKLVKDRQFQVLMNSTHFNESELEALYFQFRNAVYGHLGEDLENDDPCAPMVAAATAAAALAKSGTSKQDLEATCTPTATASAGLSLNNFRSIMTSIYSPPQPEHTDRLFTVLDGHGTGHLSFIQFINGLHILLKEDMAKKVDACFRMYDENSNGFLDREECGKMLESFLEYAEAHNLRVATFSPLPLVVTEEVFRDTNIAQGTSEGTGSVKQSKEDNSKENEEEKSKEDTEESKMGKEEKFVEREGMEIQEAASKEGDGVKEQPSGKNTVSMGCDQMKKVEEKAGDEGEQEGEHGVGEDVSIGNDEVKTIHTGDGKELKNLRDVYNVDHLFERAKVVLRGSQQPSGLTVGEFQMLVASDPEYILLTDWIWSVCSAYSPLRRRMKKD